MAFSQSSKLHRYKHYLKVLFQVYQPECHFCKKQLDWKSFYPQLSGMHLDEFLVHHKNGRHKDDRPKNLSFAHRTCHGEYNWSVRKGGKR